MNPSEEELETVQVQMEARRAKLKLKKSGKREATNSEKVDNKGKKLKKEANPPQGSSSKIAQKLLTLEDPAIAKLKSGYSVAKDPNASDVFKSLFTSSDKAKNQTKAHWVTYNPFYN